MPDARLHHVDAVPAARTATDGAAAADGACPNLTDPRLAMLYRRFASIAALAALLIAAITVFGWEAGMPGLTTVGPAWATTRMNAAIALFMLAAALLVLLQAGGRLAHAKMLAAFATGIAVIIAATSLAEDLIDVSLGIDQILLVRPTWTRATMHLGRLHPLTSLCLLLMAGALPLTRMRGRRLNWLLELCCVVTLITALLVLIGYVLGNSELFTLAAHSTAMGFNAALALLLLALGIMCSRPDHLLFQRLASAGCGGVMLRRLLPLAILIISAILVLRMWAQHAGWFQTTEFGATLGGTSTIIGVAAILIWSAGRLDALDTAHSQAERQTVRLNDMLCRKIAELEASNHELEAFTYTISHDLRTPLRAVDGFSRVLSEDYADKLDDEGVRIIGVIRQGTRTLAQLIDDILALSRIGRIEMAPCTVDMDELVQEVIQELQPAIEHRNVRFAIAPLPAAYGDRRMLRRVWENLLDNAVKYTATRDAAVIAVAGEHVGSNEEYSVRDNGIGFDMQFAGKLFGLFSRLHRADEFPGTGVGLATVRRIVSRHGGRVWAEAQPEAGATFHFTVPARETAHGRS